MAPPDPEMRRSVRVISPQMSRHGGSAHEANQDNASLYEDDEDTIRADPRQGIPRRRRSASRDRQYRSPPEDLPFPTGNDGRFDDLEERFNRTPAEAPSRERQYEYRRSQPYAPAYYPSPAPTWAPQNQWAPHPQWAPMVPFAQQQQPPWGYGSNPARYGPFASSPPPPPSTEPPHDEYRKKLEETLKEFHEKEKESMKAELKKKAEELDKITKAQEEIMRQLKDREKDLNDRKIRELEAEQSAKAEARLKELDEKKRSVERDEQEAKRAKEKQETDQKIREELLLRTEREVLERNEREKREVEQRVRAQHEEKERWEREVRARVEAENKAREQKRIAEEEALLRLERDVRIKIEDERRRDREYAMVQAEKRQQIEREILDQIEAARKREEEMAKYREDMKLKFEVEIAKELELERKVFDLREKETRMDLELRYRAQLHSNAVLASSAAQNDQSFPAPTRPGPTRHAVGKTARSVSDFLVHDEDTVPDLSSVGGHYGRRSAHQRRPRPADHLWPAQSLFNTDTYLVEAIPYPREAPSRPSTAPVRGNYMANSLWATAVGAGRGAVSNSSGTRKPADGIKGYGAGLETIVPRPKSRGARRRRKKSEQQLPQSQAVNASEVDYCSPTASARKDFEGLINSISGGGHTAAGPTPVSIEGAQNDEQGPKRRLTVPDHHPHSKGLMVAPKEVRINAPSSAVTSLDMAEGVPACPVRDDNSKIDEDGNDGENGDDDEGYTTATSLISGDPDDGERHGEEKPESVVEILAWPERNSVVVTKSAMAAPNRKISQQQRSPSSESETASETHDGDSSCHSPTPHPHGALPTSTSRTSSSVLQPHRQQRPPSFQSSCTSPYQTNTASSSNLGGGFSERGNIYGVGLPFNTVGEGHGGTSAFERQQTRVQDGIRSNQGRHDDEKGTPKRRRRRRSKRSEDEHAATTGVDDGAQYVWEAAAPEAPAAEEPRGVKEERARQQQQREQGNPAWLPGGRSAGRREQGTDQRGKGKYTATGPSAARSTGGSGDPEVKERRRRDQQVNEALHMHQPTPRRPMPSATSPLPPTGGRPQAL